VRKLINLHRQTGGRGLEKVIEVCTVQMNIGNKLITLLCIYRSACGNFGEFAVPLDLIFVYVYKPK